MKTDKVNKIVGEILGYDEKTPDFCGSVSDGWPVIYYNQISIIADCNKWTAIYYLDGKRETFEKFTHEHPLYAAMVVFARSRGYKV